MKVISLRAHRSPACRAHPDAGGPAGPEVSAGYSAAFLTLAGVVGGGGVTFQSPNGCKPGLFSAGSNERCSG